MLADRGSRGNPGRPAGAPQHRGPCQQGKNQRPCGDGPRIPVGAGRAQVGHVEEPHEGADDLRDGGANAGHVEGRSANPVPVPVAFVPVAAAAVRARPRAWPAPRPHGLESTPLGLLGREREGFLRGLTA